MTTRLRLPIIACAIALLVCSLAGCANANTASTSQAASSGESAAAAEQTLTREDVEGVLTGAANMPFSSVSYAIKTESSVTGAAQNGQPTSQSMVTSMKGQLDRSGEKPRLHMDYKTQSSAEIGVTAYEMFIDAANLIVRQGEQLFADTMTDTVLNSYVDSVLSIMSTNEISSILDMASSFKMQDNDGAKTVSLTIDKDKLAQSNLVDSSQLPETAQIATMVVTYDIGADGRFKAVRLMSSTSGTPTYRVSQTYEYSDYDAVQMPEWPDLNAYTMQQSGIATDANGNMYIVGDDGQVYYVTSIGEDGTAYFNTGAAPEAETYYYYETVPEEAAASSIAYVMGDVDSTTQNVIADADERTSESGGNGEQGRAYITADDGTVHYLDEEGSRVFDNGDGSRYFIDADGNFYFLSE